MVEPVQALAQGAGWCWQVLFPVAVTLYMSQNRETSLITPARERQRRHRARVKAEIALQPIEATTARQALESILRLREQLQKWVNSPKFAKLPPEQQIPIHSLLNQVNGNLEMFALHHRQLAGRISKVMGIV